MACPLFALDNSRVSLSKSLSFFVAAIVFNVFSACVMSSKGLTLAMHATLRSIKIDVVWNLLNF